MNRAPTGVCGGNDALVGALVSQSLPSNGPHHASDLRHSALPITTRSDCPRIPVRRQIRRNIASETKRQCKALPAKTRSPIWLRPTYWPLT